ncbi:MAG: polyprenyl synthetase family protein [[Clostridium] fimetarium]|nr:polyprenyl synthetase family protein [Alistipes timonensis]MCM1406200.1 polyprenyl synthetase family protein [[Clostridium] fimetarium]
MGNFKSIQQSLAPELTRLNSLIRQTLDSPNELMNRVIATYLRKEGKQVRPILVMLCAKLFGEVSEKALKGAAAVELLHNASLIHDDVVDDTTTRRGEQTINALWDNHLAVLIGDFFLSNALLQAAATDDIRIVNSISELGRLLSIGELDEIYTARFNNLDEEAYFQIIFRKTASLFVACAEVGVFAAGIDKEDPRGAALVEYSRLLGLCFQIKDDIFDYYADAAIGKPTGNDLREGKITLPLLHTLRDETIAGCADMRELARKESLSADEIATLITYAIDNGGIDYAYSVMRGFRDRASELLDATFAPSPALDALKSLIDFIIERDH